MNKIILLVALCHSILSLDAQKNLLDYVDIVMNSASEAVEEAKIPFESFSEAALNSNPDEFKNEVQEAIPHFQEALRLTQTAIDNIDAPKRHAASYKCDSSGSLYDEAKKSFQAAIVEYRECMDFCNKAISTNIQDESQFFVDGLEEILDGNRIMAAGIDEFADAFEVHVACLNELDQKD